MPAQEAPDALANILLPRLQVGRLRNARDCPLPLVEQRDRLAFEVRGQHAVNVAEDRRIGEEIPVVRFLRNGGQRGEQNQKDGGLHRFISSTNERTCDFGSSGFVNTPTACSMPVSGALAYGLYGRTGHSRCAPGGVLRVQPLWRIHPPICSEDSTRRSSPNNTDVPAAVSRNWPALRQSCRASCRSPVRLRVVIATSNGNTSGRGGCTFSSAKNVLKATDSRSPVSLIWRRLLRGR